MTKGKLALFIISFVVAFFDVLYCIIKGNPFVPRPYVADVFVGSSIVVLIFVLIGLIIHYITDNWNVPLRKRN